MRIANPLGGEPDDYSIGPHTSRELDMSLFLLMPDSVPYDDVSNPSSYRTAVDEVENLDITEKIQRVFSTCSRSISNRRVQKDLTMLTHDDSGVSCWLCKDAHVMFRCPYLNYEQQLFTAYRNYTHCTTDDSRTRRMWIQQARQADPAPYVARLREAREMVWKLTENGTDPRPAIAQLRRRWTRPRRDQPPAPARQPSSESSWTRTEAARLSNRDFRDRSRKAMLFME